MAKQTVNTGTSANDRTGDSLRTAFTKINANFTELYTALGLNADGTLNLGAFEFTGSVISTTDSSGITIDQAVTVASDLTVSGDVVPTVAQGGDLGSLTKPWRSLYVSGDTVFIGGTPVRINENGDLTVDGNVVASGDVSYNDLTNKPTIPADIGDLTDTGNLLFDGDYGSLTNQPVIPTDVSDLTDTTNLFFDRSYNSLTDTPTIPADVSDLTDTGNLLGPGSELVGTTVAAVGGTASANETGITYSNKIAIFTEGAFTVGVWTDVQIGWTVTDNNGFTDTIASRGGFGAASFVTTVNNWPAPASGKTYVFTSPDYQPASASPVEITVGNNDWLFSNNGTLTFPDATVQTTAYTGTANIARNIESENDISIQVNLTDSTTRTWRFGEDGDLTFPDNSFIEDSIAFMLGARDNLIIRSDSAGVQNDWIFGADGTLTLPGDIHGAPVMSIGPTPSQVGRTVNITPADDASDKKFKFRIDQYGETFTRSYLELPTAEVDKQVAAVFPHTNNTAGYIFTQGTNTNDDGMNDAFNIFYNNGDIKITSMGSLGGLYTWKFGDTGNLTLPGDIRSEREINIDINLSDSTLRRWTFGEDGDLSLPGDGLLGQVWGDGIDTELTLKSPPGVGDSGYVALSSANERNYVEVSNIGVVLGVEFGQAGFKKLTFGTDGNLKSADGEPLQILSTGAGGAVSMAWSSSLDSPENIALVIANSPGAQTSGAVDIVVGAIAGPNIWTFDPSGALTIPGDIQSEEDISIRINLADSTQRVWQFGEDGDLTLPAGGTILDSSGQPYVNGVSSINTSVSTSIFTDASGDYQYGTLSYDYAVNGVSNSFSIEYSRPLIGGNVDIHVGNTIVNGDLTLSGDIRSDSNINIDVNLTDSTLRRWQFGADGNLNYPDGAISTGGAVYAAANSSVAMISNNEHNQVRVEDDYAEIFTSSNGITLKTWRFSNTGNLTIPGDIKSDSNINIDINLADSTLRRWQFGEDGNFDTPGGVSVAGILKIDDGVHEQFQTKADATGVVTHDCALGHIIYHTSPDDYFTVNLTNLNLASGYATSITVVMVQGATGYGPNALQIGGVAQTINWQGGSLPAAPTANGVDVMTFSILNNSGTYTVLAQVTGFNEVA